MSDKEEYRVTSMEFKGEDSVGHYNYLLSFNKSLVHTGRLTNIEDGLNGEDKLTKLKEQVEDLEKFGEVQIPKTGGATITAISYHEVISLIEELKGN